MMDLFSLKGQTAVVTGGSGGMAFAVCKHLLKAGASIALVDFDQVKLAAAETALALWFKEQLALDSVDTVVSSNPQLVSSWICDISDETQVSNSMRLIRKHHGRSVNILINTAGYCENIPALEYTAEKINRLLSVNLTGSMIVASQFVKVLLQDREEEKNRQLNGKENGHNDLHEPSGSGTEIPPTTASIILIASMSGSIINYPQPQTPYNISKAGVIHLAKSLASEWAHLGIRVNALSPGYILTPLTKAILAADSKLKSDWESKVPLARMANPEEFAGPIIFMASNASSYMTGSNLIVDGGYTIW